MPEGKRTSLVKPTVTTPFHIDFDWWNKTDRNLRVYLKSHLCELHRDLYAESSADCPIDWVDPHTAQVKRVDGILYQLREQFVFGRTGFDVFAAHRDAALLKIHREIATHKRRTRLNFLAGRRAAQDRFHARE